VFILALIWWERRRPRQASGAGAERFGARDPEPQGAGVRVTRESLALPEMRARDPLVGRELPVVEIAHERRPAVPAVPAVPVLSPLQSAHDAARPEHADPADPADPVDPVEAAMAGAVATPAEMAEDPPATATEVAPPSVEDARNTVGALPSEPVREEIPRLPAGPSPVVDWPPDAHRQIVSLRLVAATPERFVGRSLRQALAAEGFVLGRFAIFHKPDDEQRAVLSAASLTRPGTFDADTMDSQHFGGLSLFAVLPGPRPASQAFEDLISTARNLNDRLHGVLQDERGSPLTSARIALLRERIGSGSLA
jgi:cell division protein ZipA